MLAFAMLTALQFKQMNKSVLLASSLVLTIVVATLAASATQHSAGLEIPTNSFHDNGGGKPSAASSTRGGGRLAVDGSAAAALASDSKTCEACLPSQDNNSLNLSALTTPMPATQLLPLEQYQPYQPSIAISFPHMAVATHTGYIVFFHWIDDYPTVDNPAYNDNEVKRGYWQRVAAFYQAEEDDTDATPVISGGTCAVGMPDVSTKYGQNAGVVYIYEFIPSTTTKVVGRWEARGPLMPNYFPEHLDEYNMQQKINDQTDHAFGSSLILEDNVLVVGAPGVDDFNGAFYIFTKHYQSSNSNKGSSYQWVQHQQHTPPEINSECPGAIFGGGIQMAHNTIAVGADCDRWMFIYHYHAYDLVNSRLIRVQDDNGTFVRKDDNEFMAAVVVTKDYFIYSVYDKGIYIFENHVNESKGGWKNGAKENEKAPFRKKQFIDAVPFSDRGFGGHMIMTEEENVLIVCGDHHLFFFAVNNSTTAIENDGDSFFELVLAFESPKLDRGIAYSNGQLILAGPESVYTMDLKEVLQSIKDEQTKPPQWLKDGVVELEVSPVGSWFDSQ